MSENTRLQPTFDDSGRLTRNVHFIELQTNGNTPVNTLRMEDWLNQLPREERHRQVCDGLRVIAKACKSVRPAPLWTRNLPSLYPEACPKCFFQPHCPVIEDARRLQ